MSSGPAHGAAAIAQVVKISYRCPSGWGARSASASSALERSILETGRVEVYDIYFDFNSDRIREQSEPTLREIGELLRRHPDWALGIEGHTDSIADDQFNLELSARRAAAVKAALAGRYGIARERLTTSGAGESCPKERNDTPEGRARNRRVELVRRK
jgi:outer membrane protein OmpA-like peptidoglycan-associated protein